MQCRTTQHTSWWSATSATRMKPRPLRPCQTSVWDTRRNLYRLYASSQVIPATYKHVRDTAWQWDVNSLATTSQQAEHGDSSITTAAGAHMLLSAQFKAVFIELPTRTSIDFIISDRWPSSSWLQLSQYGVHQSIHDELDKLRSSTAHLGCCYGLGRLLR